MATALISYADAKAAGLKRYFTGEPCKHGHIAERFVSSCGCVECTRAMTLRWSKNNTAEIRARKLERYPDLAQREAARTAAYRERNPEVIRAYKKQWLATPKGKAQNAAYASKRRAQELQRTPPWADVASTQQIFAEAVELTEFTGIEWHVDHVIPLQGKLVSGLHVRENLQLLPAIENMRKHNKFEITT